MTSDQIRSYLELYRDLGVEFVETHRTRDQPITEQSALTVVYDINVDETIVRAATERQAAARLRRTLHGLFGPGHPYGHRVVAVRGDITRAGMAIRAWAGPGPRASESGASSAPASALGRRA